MFAYVEASKTFGSNLIFVVVIAQFLLLLDVEGGLRTGQLWRVHTYCVGLTFVRCRGWTPHQTIVALATFVL